jgi:RNA recognition motif-containing protein
VEREILLEHFRKFGNVENVKLLPRKPWKVGKSCFVDFHRVKDAQKCVESENVIRGVTLYTDYNDCAGKASSGGGRGGGGIGVGGGGGGGGMLP